MNQEPIVLCGASVYTHKFYLNPEFNGLPEGIKEDLKIMCGLYCADIGGTLQLIYDEEGNLYFETDKAEDDLLFDEIGSALKIKQFQREKMELLESLEMYYKVFFLGEEYTDSQED